MLRQDHHLNRGRWLMAAGAGALALGLACQAEAEGPRHYDAIVQLNGAQAGAYFEDTRQQDGRLVDEVKQSLVLNRLGSRVSIDSDDAYFEDAQGRLLGGRFQESSAKDAIVVELAVKGQTLELISHVGDKAYVHSIAFQGPAIGPEGVRRIMRRIRSGAPEASYQTYVSALGALAKETLDFQGAETLEVEGRPVAAFKYRQTVAGLPGALTLWTDAEGYTLKASQDSPFGPVTFVRGTADAKVLAAGADLPAEVYENTEAVSNIRLPHARELDAITVEIAKKSGAEGGWPDFASAGQRVISETPRRVVLRIARASLPGSADTSAPTPDDTAPNALIQSDLPAIRAAAEQAVGDETDPWKRALKLQTWVNRHMTFDAGIAVAPASEVIRDRHGTCLGYSILLASLARAEGIPARMRMGYVYLEDMWGGHAWVEVYVHGRWLPLDAAVYEPGASDPARIAASTETGAGGTLTGVGALAQLYGKVEIRTLDYRLDGRSIQTSSAPDHQIQGDTYRNRWLGLQVTRPAGFVFGDLGAHYPSNMVLSMKGPDGQVSVHQVTAITGQPLAGQVMTVLSGVPGGARFGPPEPVVWDGKPAVRVSSPGSTTIAAMKGDQLWMVIAVGPNSGALLDQALPGVSIADLKG
jgi:transglutaminase-like putative cysteine protease